MVLTFDSNLQILDEYCHSHSGFVQGTASSSNLICKRYASNMILIDGYSSLSSGATLSIQLYMQLADLTPGNTYNSAVNIVVYSSDNRIIINADTAPCTIAVSGYGSQSLAFSSTMTRPYAKGDHFPLYITFRLRSNNLVNGDYLLVDFGKWVPDAATTGVQVFKYQVAGTIYWVPSAAVKVNDTAYRVPVYNNYSMNSGVDITLRVDTHAPAAYFGVRNPEIQWNTFGIKAYKSGNIV